MSRPLGMTVAELIEALQDLSEEQQQLPVAFVCDYGDYHHTQQALFVSAVDNGETILEESAYSRSGWAEKSTEEDEDLTDEEREAEYDGAPRVLVIR